MAYTTTLSVLRKLCVKGWARSQADAGVHFYAATYDKSRARSEALFRMQQLLYDGSRELMLRDILEGKHLRKPVLRRFRAILDERLRDMEKPGYFGS